MPDSQRSIVVTPWFPWSVISGKDYNYVAKIKVESCEVRIVLRKELNTVTLIQFPVFKKPCYAMH